MRFKAKLPQLIGLCILSTVAIGITLNTFGVFYTPISEDLGIPQSTVSFSATLCSLLIGFMAGPALKMARKTKPLPVMLFGALAAAASFGLLACAKSGIAVLACAVLRGCGCSCFFLPVITYLLGLHFTENRGFVTGIVTSFSGLGGAVLNPIMTGIIASAGWKTACLVTGGITLVLTPIGVLLSVKGAVITHSEAERSQSFRDLLTGKFFACAAFGFLASGISALATFFSAYSIFSGIGAMTGAAMMSAAMISNIVVKLIFGVMADKLGVFRSAAIMAAILLIGTVSLAVFRAPVLLIASAVLFGADYALSNVCVSLLTRKMWREEEYARVYPYMNMTTSVSYAIYIALIGAILNLFDSYLPVFIFIGLSGALLLVLIPVMKKQCE